MYVLAVVAMLSTGTFASLPEFKLYNTEQACQANGVDAMQELTEMLLADGNQPAVMAFQCIPAIPALERNPYERGA